MNSHNLTKRLLIDMRELVDKRRDALQSGSRKAVHKSLAIKQAEKVERELVEVLEPMFLDQIDNMAKQLGGMTGTNESNPIALAKLIFVPEEWHDRLVNLTLPILVRNMAEAGITHLRVLGVDVRVKEEKETTASEWAREHSAEWDSLEEVFRSSGLPLGVLAETPQWMKDIIARRLDQSFAQSYWADVSMTTMGDAEKYLRQGLEEGWSIDKMARNMREHFMGGGLRYARARSENIARTESGHALNASRKESVNHLQEEIPEVPMKQVWLSVLSATTRDTHANLDGVPEDENGMWNLSGYIIPWPGYISLPPELRCNCMCSIYTEFGMNNLEALQILGEYSQRM